MLSAETQLLASGTPAALTAVQDALGPLAERLAPDLLILDFGNAVGQLEVPHFGRIEIVSGKWGARDFDAMLADLMAIASALPFDAGTPAALPYDRSVAAQEDVLYHAFVYLRHILSEVAPPHARLIPALTSILRRPHRTLERVRRRVPLELARRIDAEGLSRIASGQGRPTRITPAQAAQIPLARALRGHLPTEVQEGQVRILSDTPENRFVKAFLGQVDGLIDAMRRTASAPGRASPFRQQLLVECDSFDRLLHPIRSDPFWRSIGTMSQLPMGSTILQRRSGYREVFGHFARLRLAARVPLEQELLARLLETKDIAELYELWTFFVLVRELEGLLGPPERADVIRADQFAVGMPRAYTVTWASGTTAVYNQTFSRSKPTARRSFSVPLRPDVALDVVGGPHAGLHLFDAKFKLDRADTILADGDDDPDAVEERRGTFKRADLYKMHTYRDAIPRARSVWILYPGTDFRFYSTDGRILGADDLSHAAEGVGAIPLRPEADGTDDLRDALARLLDRETARPRR